MKRSMLAISFICIILEAWSCGIRKGARDDDSFSVKPGAVYRLSPEINDSRDAEAGELPWALAPLVSGIAVSGDYAFLGINRLGGAFLKNGDHGMEYLPVRGGPAFETRTIGSVFAYKDRFYCHLYWNSFFGEGNGPDSRISLVSIAPGETSFRQERMPFESTFDPSWQVTGLYAFESADWVVELKKTEPERTEFAYVAFAPGQGQWKEISRESFELILEPKTRAREPLAGMLSSMVESDRGTIALVRTSGFPDIEVYELSEGDDSLLIQGFSSPDGIAVTARDRGLFSAKTGILGSFSLVAPVPPGSEITGNAVFGNHVIVAWEEGEFPSSRSAGFTVLDPAAGAEAVGFAR